VKEHLSFWFKKGSPVLPKER